MMDEFILEGPKYLILNTVNNSGKTCSSVVLSVFHGENSL